MSGLFSVLRLQLWQDPLALSSGALARLLAAAVVLGVLWAAVAWAMQA